MSRLRSRTRTGRTTCVHTDGRSHPNDTLPCPLLAALERRYVDNGAAWWNAWDHAAPARRRAMERAILR